MSAMLYSLVSALLLSNGALAVGTAFGYAAGTTGGGSATPAVPSSTAQLVSWYVNNLRCIASGTHRL
jgi:pectin lyase